MSGLISNQEERSIHSERWLLTSRLAKFTKSGHTKGWRGRPEPHTLPGQGSSVAQVSERPGVHTRAQAPRAPLPGEMLARWAQDFVGLFTPHVGGGTCLFAPARDTTREEVFAHQKLRDRQSK